MVFTKTAISFTLLALGLAICGWRFLSVFNKNENGSAQSKIGIFLSAFFFLAAAQNGVLGLGAFFFTKNPDGLYSTVLLSYSLLAILAVVSVYTFFYIFRPKVSLKIPVLFTSLFGLIVVGVTIYLHPQPTITAQNSVDWGADLYLAPLLFVLFALSLGPNAYLFFKLYKSTSMRQLKILAAILMLFTIAGIINVFFRLIVFANGPSLPRANFLDLGVSLLGIGFVILFVVVPMFWGYLRNNKSLR